MKRALDTGIWRGQIGCCQGEYEIRGKYGLVSAYGTDELDVWLTNRRVAFRLEHEGWKVKSHYDDGVLFIRPESDLNKAAKAIRAGRKRIVTEAMRETGRRLAARMQSLKAKSRSSASTAA